LFFYRQDSVGEIYVSEFDNVHQSHRVIFIVPCSAINLHLTLGKNTDNFSTGFCHAQRIAQDYSKGQT
jgi:hypothetical protein